MPAPTILEYPNTISVQCGKRFSLKVEVEVYGKTNLTVSFKLIEPTSCSFLTQSGKTKKEVSRKRNRLSTGAHELTFYLKFTCPHGNTYYPFMDVTANNPKKQEHTVQVSLEIKC